jgi:hypothetical protein
MLVPSRILAVGSGIVPGVPAYFTDIGSLFI